MSSSQTLTQMASFGTQRSHQSMMSPNESRVVWIERIISILSENKLKSWFDVGIKAEYQRRYGQPLPDDWIRVLEECGRDVIEVNVQNYSNVSKTFIALPIKSVRKSTGASTPSAPTAAAKPMDTSSPPPVPTAPVTPPKVQQIVPKAMPSDAPTVAIPAPKTPTNGSTNGGPKGRVIDAAGDERAVDAFAGNDNVLAGSRPIPAPVLPSVNPTPTRNEDFYDVVVLLVATPKNFIVVPFDNVSIGSAFAELKQRMHDFYERDDNRIDLTADVVSEGLYVAGKARECWYRMEVKNVISREPFQVVTYLCDYGEHLTLDVKDIQPLYNTFRDLPAQAIRASLAGVEPLGADWDVMTSVEFRKLVESRPFVATVYAINSVDEQPVLSLSLCDTSGAEDVYISAELVKKGLAKAVVSV